MSITDLERKRRRNANLIRMLDLMDELNMMRMASEKHFKEGHLSLAHAKYLGGPINQYQYDARMKYSLGIECMEEELDRERCTTIDGSPFKLLKVNDGDAHPPIDWFGGMLAPQSLRNAKDIFLQSIQTLITISNLQTQIDLLHKSLL